MRKRIVYGIAIIIAFFIGVGSSLSAKASGSIEIESAGNSGGFYVHNVIDWDTGVQYLLVQDYGRSEPAIAMCPRYNADGTLYTGE